MKNGYAEKVKVLEKTGARIKFQKFYEKIWKFKNNAYLCSPVRKTGPRKRQKKFIEKTDLLYKKQVPRKYNLSRSVNSFGELLSVRSDWKIIMKLYNEEFDPGSG